MYESGWRGAWVNLVQARQAVRNLRPRRKTQYLSNLRRLKHRNWISDLNANERWRKKCVRWSPQFACRRFVQNEINELFDLSMPAHDENNDVIDFVQFDRWLGIKVYSRRTRANTFNMPQYRKITDAWKKPRKNKKTSTLNFNDDALQCALYCVFNSLACGS